MKHAPTLALGVTMLGALAVEAGDVSQNFGRWESQPDRCQMRSASLGRPAIPCTTVQLGQQVRGQLSIRFIAAPDAEGVTNQVTFVGQLADAGSAMICSEGRCQPDEKDQVSLVSSFSHGRFDARGVALELPKGWPAAGSCSLSAVEVSCQSTTFTRDVWQASATF